MDQVVGVEEKEKIEREKLEEMIHLRIKEGIEAMEVFSNKVTDLHDISEEVRNELNEIRKEWEEKEMMVAKEIQKKGEFEKLVDMETPHVPRFLIQANNIILQ